MSLPERLRWMACDEHYKGSRYERYLLDAADRLETLQAATDGDMLRLFTELDVLTAYVSGEMDEGDRVWVEARYRGVA